MVFNVDKKIIYIYIYVPGYDHRRLDSLSSERFALLSAAVCLHRGFRLYFFNKMVATPLVVGSVSLFVN